MSRNPVLGCQLSPTPVDVSGDLPLPTIIHFAGFAPGYFMRKLYSPSVAVMKRVR